MFDEEELIKRLKSKSRKMVEARTPHKYYRAVGTGTIERIIKDYFKEVRDNSTGKAI